jgi:stearoyl-CoA desaturase (delta-9 desaturase)
MMVQTKNIYLDFIRFKIEPEPAFRDNYPTWPLIDKIGDLWITPPYFYCIIYNFLCVFCRVLVDVSCCFQFIF